MNIKFFLESLSTMKLIFCIFLMLNIGPAGSNPTEQTK